MEIRKSVAAALVCVSGLVLAVTTLDAQEHVRIDGQVQWIGGTRLQVMTGGGSIAVDLRQSDQAAHRGLRTGERVIVDGVVADDRRSVVAREIWLVGLNQRAGESP